MPSSRLTIAAWHVRPPRLVTMAAAIFMAGSQSGSVMSATSTSPGRKSCSCVDVFHHPRRPGADLFPDASPLQQQPAFLFEAIDLERGPLARHGMHRLGPRLQDEQAPGLAVLAPFDVHRHRPLGLGRVVLLDQASPARQGQHVVVRQDSAAGGLQGAPARSGCCGRRASRRSVSLAWRPRGVSARCAGPV